MLTPGEVGVFYVFCLAICRINLSFCVRAQTQRKQAERSNFTPPISKHTEISQPTPDIQVRCCDVTSHLVTLLCRFPKPG